MQTSSNQTNRILRLPDVKARTGLSRSSIYAFIKDGKFPQHIALGERCVGWYESEVDAWVASRQRVNRHAQPSQALDCGNSSAVFNAVQLKE